MKYDSQLNELRTQLQNINNAIIVLPSQINVDKLASGLTLFLSLTQAGKSAHIVTEDTIRVSHTNLYGVGKVTNQMPSVSGGNFVITLEGVVETQGEQAGTVPSLEKLDWYPEGSNLNLVFHVLPGQKFEPKNVVPKYEGGSGASVVFVIGAQSLNDLGNIYQNNQSIFSNALIVNIDNNPNNSNFGKTNVIDPNTSSIAEMIYQILPGLGLPTDNDMASNILNGIYDATSSLTRNVKPDTFMVVGQAMQAGGQLPQQQPIQPQPQPVQPEPQSQIVQPAPVIPQTPPPSPVEPATTPAPEQNPMTQWFSMGQQQLPQQSPEEQPKGEYARSGGI